MPRIYAAAILDSGSIKHHLECRAKDYQKRKEKGNNVEERELLRKVESMTGVEAFAELGSCGRKW